MPRVIFIYRVCREGANALSMGSLLIAWLGMLCLLVTFKDRLSRKLLYSVALVVLLGTLGCWGALM